MKKIGKEKGKQEVKKELEKRMDRLHEKIEVTEIVIREEKGNLFSYKKELEMIEKQLNNLSYYEEQKRAEYCHNEIKEVLIDLGYRFTQKDNNIYMKGEVLAHDSFKTWLQISFNDTDFINNEDVLKKIRTILRKYDIETAEFQYEKSEHDFGQYYYVYSTVVYNGEHKKVFRPR